MSKIFKSISVLMAVVIVFTLGGCSQPNKEKDSKTTSSVTLLLGKNKITSRLSLNSKALNSAVIDAAMNEGKIAAVSLEGNPVVFASKNVESDPNNQTTGRMKQLANNAINELSASIQDFVPQSSEVDIIESINLSIDSLTASDATGEKYLYILAPFLSTTGILDMTTFNIFETNSEILVDRVAQYVRDMNGINVKWMNIADVNSEIQQNLDNTQINVLKDFASALITSKGGTVEFLSDEGDYIIENESYPNVTSVVIPENKVSAEGINYKLDDTQVRFEPNTATLIDEDAAYKAVNEISQSIIDSGQSVTLIGSTASWGTEKSCLLLAEKRCNKVKQILVEQGVDENRIQIKPIGRDPKSPLRVTDLDNDGNFIESEGKKNRFVLVTSDPDLVY